MKRRASRRRILWWIGALGLAATSALWIIGAIRPISGASDRLGLIWHLDGGSVYLWYSTTGQFDGPWQRGQTANVYATFLQSFDGCWLPETWRPTWMSRTDVYIKVVGQENTESESAIRRVYLAQAPMFWLQLPFILTLAWLFFTRRLRRKPGHCQKCNYNLTGNISGRCPECGEAVPAAMASPEDLVRLRSEREVPDAGT